MINYLFLNDFRTKFKKHEVFAKKHLRVSGTNLRTPFNGNADTQRQTPNGPNGSGNADRR